jgi:shikimate kinase
MIIQFIGLPGAGKTTIADALKDRINGLHINADDVRNGINKDLGFSIEDRVENARRLGEMARLMERKQDRPVIVDFVAPTEETRKAFGKADIVVWVDTITEGRFEDTNKLWEVPSHYDHKIVVTGDDYQDSIPTRTFKIITDFNLFDWKADSTLMLGRYQPWHEGHRALYEEAKPKNKQTVIAVRHTQGMTDKDPMSFEDVRKNILADVPDAIVIKAPNFKSIVYGRDVGYSIEQINLSPELQAISATQKRKEMGL